MKRFLNILYRLLLISAALVLPIILFKNSQLRDSIENILKNSKWHLVLLACLLNAIVITFSRTKRFATLIQNLTPKNGRKLSIFNLFTIMNASRALGVVLPAKSGELFRTAQLWRTYGYTPGSIIAATLIEMAFDVLSLSILIFIVFIFGLINTSLATLLFPLIALGTIGVLFIFLIQKRPSKLRNSRNPIFNLKNSFFLISDAKIRWRAILWTFINDGADILMIHLCLRAVHISLSFLDLCLILVVINAVILIPVPGHIGTLEAGGILILGMFGVPREQALSFALLYHSAHLIPVILLGSISLYIEAFLKGKTQGCPPQVS